MKKIINILLAIPMNLQMFAEAGTAVNATGSMVNAYTGATTAYDGNGFILRLFERTGKSCKTKISLPDGYKLDCEVNLLEDKIGKAVKKVQLNPFQIRSFRVIKK